MEAAGAAFFFFLAWLRIMVGREGPHGNGEAVIAERRKAQLGGSGIGNRDSIGRFQCYLLLIEYSWAIFVLTILV